MSVIQSVLFNIKYWTVPKAMEWLIEHDLKPIKLDITEHYLRMRQVHPETLSKKGFVHYVTKKLKNNIEFVIAMKPNLGINSNSR